MRRLVVSCAVALAACAQPQQAGVDEASDTVAMSAETEESEAPSAEAALAVAAVPTGQYSAVSRSALSITGDLTLGDVALTFAMGQTYRTERIGVLEASAAVAGTRTLAQLYNNISPTTGVEVRRVTAQELGAAARNGSLCGRDTVTYVTLAAATGADGMPGLWIAAFKGAEAPGAGSAEADLCGTFSYAPASL